MKSGGLVPTPTGTKSITQNGTHDVTNYASADVDVPNSYSASDEGKVVDNGALVSQTSRGVTQNGTYDTTTNDEIVVNVQGGGGGGVIQPLSVTQNGTYTPPSGVDGYAPVTVNVSGGGGELLTPAYEGLSYAFCGSNGSFSTWNTKTNYMSFFEVSANTEYFLFAANDAGNRFRATFFSGKTISDFTQYIENPYENAIVYSGSIVVYADTRSDKRYFYTPSSQGVIAVLTSSQSITAPVAVGIMQ